MKNEEEIITGFIKEFGVRDNDGFLCIHESVLKLLAVRIQEELDNIKDK